MPSPPDSPSTFPRLVGRAVERVEDAALLTGRGRFADDVGERSGTAHATVLRSPHAHAEIVSLDAASLYRTHGHMSGPYRIANLEIHNRVVLTNKTPTGLNRGFGGPQVYFALERLVHRIAKTLGLDPLDVMRRNLVPGEAFPYRAASGSRLDSGDYRAALDTATAGGRLDRSEKLSGNGPDAITGAGEVRIGVAPAALWPILLDAERLARVIPGCKSLVAKDGHCYEGDLSVGIGPVRGRFRASVVLSDLDPPRGLSFLGTSHGPLGSSTGSGVLEPDGSGTLVRYTCRYRVTGKIAAIGARMLEGAVRAIVARLFRRLAKVADI